MGNPNNAGSSGGKDSASRPAGWYKGRGGFTWCFVVCGKTMRVVMIVFVGAEAVLDITRLLSEGDVVCVDEGLRLPIAVIGKLTEQTGYTTM
jgi:hypothetical protein